ncbi:DUF5765 domain-containing protein [Rhodovulum euryhalinum]|uniref:Uncharacterized protein n=1 Tax=Rhodovulum euryhalinum TaxID=35805 RepID=A0A4R2K999_9RHOB|nr:DUF5765 domain-containing protein [Rhodovulum euryhalinum]TCO69274.1 hypothetical protein EV655_1162 [Rhodovulum euryhalinum]
MCWNTGVTVTMVGLGAAATVIAARRGEPAAIWATLGYFTLMETLQAAGYAVVDQCGDPANRTVTLLSYLHIAFQPFFINAFAMALVGHAVPPATRRAVWAICAASAAVMVFQLVPVQALGRCMPGEVLCGPGLCTISGEWHIGWEVPLNGLFSPLSDALGFSANFPTYLIAVFLVPLAYGAWRFVLFHAAFGPFLATLLTDNPNEMPAVWCLFSIGLVLVGMCPPIRQRMAGPRAA